MFFLEGNKKRPACCLSVSVTDNFLNIVFAPKIYQDFFLLPILKTVWRQLCETTITWFNCGLRLPTANRLSLVLIHFMKVYLEELSVLVLWVPYIAHDGGKWCEIKDFLDSILFRAGKEKPKKFLDSHYFPAMSRTLFFFRAPNWQVL